MEGCLVSDKIGMMILEELKLMRKDLKKGVKSLKKEIQNYGDKFLNLKENTSQILQENDDIMQHCDEPPTTSHLYKPETINAHSQIPENEIKSFTNIKKSEVLQHETPMSLENKFDDDNNINEGNSTDKLQLFNNCERILTPEKQSQEIVNTNAITENSSFETSPNLIIPFPHVHIKEERVESIAEGFGNGSFYGAMEMEPSLNQLWMLEDIPQTIPKVKRPKKFKCRVCGKAFMLSCHLGNHMKTHSFKEIELKAHVKSKHRKVAKSELYTLRCKNCFKIFYDIGSFKVHSDTHQTRKCSVCEKEFRSLTNLSEHMKIHIGKDPFACPLCDLSFIQYAEMEKHLAKHNPHSRVYKVECQHCKMMFPSQAYLETHTEKYCQGEKKLIITE